MVTTLTRHKRFLVHVVVFVTFVSFGLAGCGSSENQYRTQFENFSKSLQSDGMKTSELTVKNTTLKFQIQFMNQKGIDASKLQTLSEPKPNHPAILGVMQKVGLMTGRIILRYRQHFTSKDMDNETLPTLRATVPDNQGRNFLTLQVNREAIKLAENMRDMTHRQKGKLFQNILRFNTSLQSGTVLKRALEEEYGLTMRELSI